LDRDLYAVPMAAEDPPRYQQIADDLRGRIERGEYPEGSLLPSTKTLEQHYRVAPNTARHAVSMLVEAGYAEPKQGLGVYVRKPAPPGPSEYELVMGRLDELSDEVRQLKGRMGAAERTLRSTAGRAHREPD
jgi:GntR family transcriptional regulator